MPTQRYNVQQPPISAILAWIVSGEIAIPEVQRPFVWNATMKIDDYSAFLAIRRKLMADKIRTYFQSL